MNTFHAFGRGIAAFAALTCVTLAENAQAQGTVVSYFNFNGLTSGSLVDVTTLTPTAGNGSLAATFNPAGVTSFAGTTVNAETGSVAGSALAFTGNAGTGNTGFNNGSFLTYSVDTTGFSSIVLSLAIQKTSTGFTSDGLSVSADGGATYASAFAGFNPPAAFAAKSVDLTSFPALNNNPNVKFRFSFDGATGTAGNNRIDNLKVTGTSASATPAPSSALIALAGAVPGLLALRRKRK